MKSIFFIGKFDSVTPGVGSANDLTDAQADAYVRGIIRDASAAGADPTVIEKALDRFKMQMQVANSDAPVTLFCADFFERLERTGCASFRDTNPKKAIKLLSNRMQPPTMKKEMQKRILYDVNHEKNLKKFISTLAREATHCQVYAVAYKDDKDNGTSKDPKQPTSKKTNSKKNPADPSKEGK